MSTPSKDKAQQALGRIGAHFHIADQDINILSAFISAAPADESTRAPDGWKLVPVELTPEMVKADPYGMGYGRLHAIWSRLLAAAPPSGERPSAPAPEVQGFGRIVGTLAKQPGARIDWPALPDASAPASAPLALALTTAEVDAFYEEWEFNGADPGRIEFHNLVREVERRLRRSARECLAAAPVADERAALRELIEALEQYASFPPSIKPALDKARAALSGGSPEPVSGSEER